MISNDLRALEFATQMMDLLDRGSVTSTYKYAVLLGLLDCCQARVQSDGTVPSVVTTRELARRVLEIYWGQARPFALMGETPRQNRGGQAEILSAIAAYRQSAPTSLFRAELSDPVGFAKLLNDVEWALIELPLPRLQLVGRVETRFLYEIAWDRTIRRKADGVTDYQRHFVDPECSPGSFDNRILLKPGVAENLVRLGPLLRPLIQRQWTQTVARFSRLEIAALDDFLFGVDRQALGVLVDPLRAVQENRCFYCEQGLGRQVEVDHFVPWSRSPNDGLPNLVLADKPCNGSKSNHLADVVHLQKWRFRNDPEHAQGRRFEREFDGIDWLRNRDESVAIARSLYLSVPSSMPLWRSRDGFEPADVDALERVLG
jgi:hypothetical protein